MPSKSPAQHRLMQAAAHTKGGFGGVPQTVGTEFVKADKKMKDGGVVQSLKNAGFYEEGKSKPERLKIVSQATSKPERLKIVEKLYSSKKMKGGGLYANINAKRKRIAEGSGEKMRKPGAPGAPTAKAFKQSAKTAKMSDGGLPDYPYRVSGRDPLASRIGSNQAFKVPRKGQTDMRNIPVGNDPSSRMSEDDYVQRTNAKERAQRPDFVKRSIKANLGKHPAPKLPKATGGKVKKSCW